MKKHSTMGWIAAVGLAASAAAAGPFDDWSYRERITFSGYNRAEALTNFPALVVFSNGMVSGFSYADFLSSTNQDLRFTDAAGSAELSYEVESWNTNGNSHVWVQVPLLTNSTEVIAYWGKAGQTAPAYTTNGAPWTNGYVGVWHLGESIVTNGAFADSAGGNHDGTFKAADGVANSVQVAGIAGSGVDFNDTDYISIDEGLESDFDLPSALTVSCWTKAWPDGGWEGWVTKQGENNLGWQLRRNSTNTKIDWTLRTFGSDYAPATQTNLTDGSWHMAAGTFGTLAGTTRQEVYYDGNLAGGQNVSGTIANSGVRVAINARYNTGIGSYASAPLDEVRIASVRRSASWLWAEFANTASNGAFQTYGAVEMLNTNLPRVATLAPFAVATSGATLNGFLSSTGTADTAVWVFWGDADPGTTNTGWVGSHAWNAPQATGAFAYAASLGWSTNWVYRFAASNAAGWYFGGAQTFMNGEVSVLATDPTATERDDGADTGQFSLRRPDWSTNVALTVSYSLSGTASNGEDYTALSGMASFAVGATNVDLLVSVIPQLAVEGDETVVLGLGAGPYSLGAMNSATVTIVDAVATEWFVRTNGSDNVSVSGTNWTEALLTLTNALARADLGDLITLSNGTFYAVSNQIVVDKGVTIRSVNGAASTTVSRFTSGDTEPRHRVMAIINVNAVVQGLTIAGGNVQRGTNGAGIFLGNGTVRDCIVRNNTTGSSATGGGIFMTNGVVTNCVIRNNTLEWGATGGGVYINTAGLVTDCTITNNTTGGGGGNSAGVHCQQGGIVRRCLIAGNSAQNSTGYSGIRLNQGGLVEYCTISNNNSGAYIAGGVGITQTGTVRNCLIVNNVSTRATDAGAGVYMSGGSVENCTISANTASAGQGGGVYATGGAITNSIIYFNTGATGANIHSNGAVVFAYCCTTNVLAGPGHITNDPAFTGAGNYRLQASSPCLNVGTTLTWMSGAVDLDGNTRVAGAGVDLGVYERADALGCSFAGTPLRGLAPLDVVLTASTAGGGTNGLYYRWDLDDNGSDDVQGFDQRVLTNTFAAGIYSIRLTVTNSVGEVASVSNVNYVASSPGTIYVATNGANLSPYTNWATAATNVTLAYGLAADGALIRVSNGTHWVNQQLALDRGVTLRSENGSAATILRRSGGSNYRVLKVTHGSVVVDGFGIQSGVAYEDLVVDSFQGGGVYMTTGVVLNCRIFGNSADSGSGSGAGVFLAGGGVVSNCTLTGNTLTFGASGGGAYLNGGGLVTDCVITNNSSGGGGGNAGGVFCNQSGGIVRRCLIAGNVAQNSTGYGGVRLYQGGLVEYCTISNNNVGAYICGGAGLYQGGALRNCLVVNNVSTRALAAGAGVYLDSGGSVENCTISANTASSGQGGGVYATVGGTLTNCVIWGNTATAGAEYWQTNGGGSFAYCDTTPAVAGTGNVSADPLFTGVGNYRLLAGSPCMNAGCNLGWMTNAVDLDGANRLVGTADMGPYERADALGCSFTGAPLRGPAPLTVTLTASATGGDTNNLTYRWDFDNNGSFDLEGTDRRVVTNAFGPGTFTVLLVVTNTSNEVASYSNVGYVVSSPSVIFVATNGANLSPYTNWVTAATNVALAVALADQGTLIRVSNGTHWVNSQLALSTGLTLRSENGATATVLRRSGASNYRVLKITHPDVVVDGFGIQNGWAYEDLVVDSYQGGGVYMTGGLIVNCRVSGNGADSGSSGGAGAGVYLAGGGTVSNCTLSGNSVSWGAWGGGAYLAGGGLVTDCVITNNGGGGGGGNGGGVACGQGGIVRRCFIANNYANYGTGAGGVRLNQGGLIESCTISNNTTDARGAGGSFYQGGTLRNGLVIDNVSTRATDAGGALYMESGGSVENCTIANNTASGWGGGVLCTNGGAVTNTIIYLNSAASGANVYSNGGGAFAYCCTTPDVPGPGNTSGDPQFANAGAKNYRLLAGSAALNAGTALSWTAGGLDLDGNARTVGSAPDMGAYERLDLLGCSFQIAPARGPAPLTVAFAATVSGSDTGGLNYLWDYDSNGTVEEQGSGLSAPSHVFAAGLHTVTLTVTNAAGERAQYSNVTAIVAAPPVIYVATNGLSIAPYTNWLTAATNLAPAIELADLGTLIRVSNGTYRQSAQLALTTGVTLRSENGATATVLYRNVSPVDSTPRFRVLKITGDALVDGFGIQNGYAYEDLAVDSYVGGGVYMTTGRVINCRISGNAAENGSSGGAGAGVCLAGGGVVSNCTVAVNTLRWGAWGGGAYLYRGGLVVDCVITNNTSGSAGGNGAGVYVNQGGTVRRCLIARNVADNGLYGFGGAYVTQTGVVELCTISNNTSSTRCGGVGLAFGATVRNCLVVNNSSTSTNAGAGVCLDGGGSLENCTVVGNTSSGANSLSGGVYCNNGGSLTNCLVYFNTAAAGSNYAINAAGTFAYCCTAPDVAGPGNISADPVLADRAGGNFRILGSSPCRNAGVNLGWMTGAVDMDRNVRIQQGGVDIGAYEFPFASSTTFEFR